MMKRHCDQCDKIPEEEDFDTLMNWFQITRGVGAREIESFEYCSKKCAKKALTSDFAHVVPVVPS